MFREVNFPIFIFVFMKNKLFIKQVGWVRNLVEV